MKFNGIMVDKLAHADVNSGGAVAKLSGKPADRICGIYGFQ